VVRPVKIVVGKSVVALGTVTGRAAASLLLNLHSAQRIFVPPPVNVGGHIFDIVADLVEFTGLPSEAVDQLLRRRADSHRVEWHLFPRTARSEDWFYRSSRSYIFTNAVHDFGSVAFELRDLVPTGAIALDFGGGTGNLTLPLAALGVQVDYLEVSALQKDFVRFRARKHGLADRIRVLDDWSPLTESRYDLLCAFDVFEHLPQLELRLREKVLPSLKPDSAIVESSPFIRNFANPMHFEDAVQLDRSLTAAGFGQDRVTDGYRVWRRRQHKPKGGR
jgi:2-polyprenyl-3-methyl-5-hydroxy-6-metoxy-1,4-benzoquinol methylase